MIFFIVFSLLIHSSLISAAQIPTQDFGISETGQIAEKDEGFNDGITKLIPLPHVLCTGFSISRLYESCFPVGCKCANGAGICNLKNECVRVQLSFGFNKDSEVDSGTNF